MTENQLGIEVKGLQKIFKIDNVQACKDVNLSINHGEFMILLDYLKQLKTANIL